VFEEEDVLEFEGEYLGGHVKYPDRGHVVLQLTDENLFVAPYAPGQCLGPPFLSIAYPDMTSVQNVPYEKISTLRVLISPLGGLIFRKNEHLLTLTFKDELDMEQTVAFKIKNTEKIHEAIYGRVVKAKKKKKLEK